uniref:RRM domain-containing protein n=1 Tax=Chlamydomonas leiostraca TaxID=1034604 RepID=A0A7S0WJY6_9CHLO|mmetsp:Transcript_16097/g.40090  ORF Transcript_16097/g.40090 Transcript_16097/m.40090 type:complete len:630 (+) Transcript_16097:83-1972(+)
MGLSPDQEAWLTSLTVNGLKDELKARGVATSSAKLKAQFQELLREALAAEQQAGAGNTAAADVQAGDVAGEARTAAKSASDHHAHPSSAGEPMQVAQPAVEPVASTAEPAPKPIEPTEPVASPAPAQPAQPEPAPEPEPVKASKPEPEPKPAPAAEPLTVDALLDDHADMEAEEQEHEPEPAPEAKPEQAGAEVVEGAAQASGRAQEAAEPSSKSVEKAAGPSAETPTEGGRKRREPIPLYQPRSTDKPGTEKKARAAPLSLTKADDAAAAAAAAAAATDSPAATPAAAPAPSPKPAAAAAAAKQLVSPKAKAAAAPAEPEPAAPPADPTTSVKIENLVRPFTENALKQLISKTGTIKDMWMPSIKTHAFVIFESVEQASATYAALHGQQWPQGTPKKLSLTFISEEAAQTSISHGRDPSLAAAAAKAAAAAAAAAKQAAKEAAKAADKGEGGKEQEGAEKSPAAESGSAEPERAGSAELGAAPAKPAAAVGMGIVAAAKRAMAAAAADSAAVRPGAKRARGDEAEGAAGSKRLARTSLDGGAAPVAEPAEPMKSLDELFRKTVAKPCIYWLQLTEEEIKSKKKREEEQERREAERERVDRRDDRRDGPRDAYPGLPRPPPLPGPPRRW